jgi:hypothetical protein
VLVPGVVLGGFCAASVTAQVIAKVHAAPNVESFMVPPDIDACSASETPPGKP